MERIPEGGFHRISVLRLSSLGDVVLTLPVVEALRAAYPEAEIVFWVKEEFADAVRFHPAISRVRCLERDASRLEDLVSMSAELEDHDLILDLHGSLRTRVLGFRQKALTLRTPSARLARERWVRARWSRPAPLTSVWKRYGEVIERIGLSILGPPRVHAGEEARMWAEERWRSLDLPVDTVALAPGAAWATKRWPERHWCALEAELAASGNGRLVVSTAAEKRAMPELAAQVERSAGATWVTEPLARAIALLSHCRRAVTHDSGLMHIAAACGVPVVALFGGTHPGLGFAPAGEGHTVLCREESCQPCALHGHGACPLGHHRCMVGIEPIQVTTALRESMPR